MMHQNPCLLRPRPVSTLSKRIRAQFSLQSHRVAFHLKLAEFSLLPAMVTIFIRFIPLWPAASAQRPDSHSTCKYYKSPQGSQFTYPPIKDRTVWRWCGKGPHFADGETEARHSTGAVPVTCCCSSFESLLHPLGSCLTLTPRNKTKGSRTLTTDLPNTHSTSQHEAFPRACQSLFKGAACPKSFGKLD